MMKIALIGYGKMGRMVHQLAKEQGHAIVAIIDSSHPLGNSASNESISHADVCIDFSTPQTVLENIRILSSLKKDIVVGTTGWDEHLNDVKKMVDESDIGLLHAPNFSLGIALFQKIVEQTAPLMAAFKQYEVAGIEMHHSKKLDRPSGTAKAIESRLNLHHTPPVNFTSVRVGDIPGTHTVIYDSPVDTITLTHTARNREGFAQGAITAAQWLLGKKGIFTLDDLLKERL